jgi:hypothetical protein|tara:strand:- start:3240 stop:3752 length:513 start_codon:yes stop_codon:yes gene_type:complete
MSEAEQYRNLVNNAKEEAIMQDTVGTNSEELGTPSLHTADFETLKYLSESDFIDDPIAIENKKTLWANSSKDLSLTVITEDEMKTLIDLGKLNVQNEIMCLNQQQYSFEKKREMDNQAFAMRLKLNKSKEGPYNNLALRSTIRKDIQINPSGSSTKGVREGLSERLRQQG